MKANRESLLDALKFASLGVSLRGETLEQSNTFVFTEEELITFNDEAMTRQPTPLPGITGAVMASEFQRLVEKLPDDSLGITVKGEEIIIKGARRTAGVTCMAEIALPFDAVPVPEKWRTIKEGAMEMLFQAARTCGKDITQELTMMVHVTPKLVEACDNFRLFRATLATGFKEGLLMASGIALLDGLNVLKISQQDGWAHWKSKGDRIISVRTGTGTYHDSMEKVLDLGTDGVEETGLPGNLSDIVGRTLIMMSGDEDPAITITLEPGTPNGKLTVTSRKAEGWFKESNKVVYAGEGLEFHVHPQFLIEMLKRTRRVMVSSSRMKMAVDGIEFVVSLVQKD